MLCLWARRKLTWKPSISSPHMELWSQRGSCVIVKPFYNWLWCCESGCQVHDSLYPARVVGRGHNAKTGQIDSVLPWAESYVNEYKVDNTETSASAGVCKDRARGKTPRNPSATCVVPSCGHEGKWAMMKDRNIIRVTTALYSTSRYGSFLTALYNCV